MIKLISEHTLAATSPDHHYPQGTKNIAGGPFYDWHGDENPFVDEVQEYFNKKDISVLDLGAASGELVKDFMVKGADAVGLEGSDWPIKNNRDSWKVYSDRLFTCDISKPFTIEQAGEIKKFDLINAWEVIEHLPPNELNQFADNVHKHLKDNGIFVVSISPWVEPSRIDPKVNLHLSHEIKAKKRWAQIFNKFEFVGPVSEKHDSAWHYIFKYRYRGKIRNSEESGRHTFWSTLMKSQSEKS